MESPPVTHTPTDLVDHTIGPYHLERLLGQGGFAWVFVGRELDGTPVAVKILKPRYGGDPQFEIRFRNEAETAAKLDHPNIIRIRFVARSGDYVYFAMDLCTDSLGARLAREGPLPESDILVIAADVARGLDFAHRQGVVHRDLKPDNILMHSDGSAVISDFGIARAVSGYVASTGVNMTIGTPHYISPEQAQGRPVDQRADFYALGVTLYKAATGEVPFTSTDWFELARMHVEQPPPSLPTVGESFGFPPSPPAPPASSLWRYVPAARRSSASSRFGNGRSASRMSNPAPPAFPASSTTPGAARSMTSISGFNPSLVPPTGRESFRVPPSP